MKICHKLGENITKWHPTKDLFSEYIKNSVKSRIRKEIQLINGQKS